MNQRRKERAQYGLEWEYKRKKKKIHTSEAGGEDPGEISDGSNDRTPQLSFSDRVIRYVVIISFRAPSNPPDMLS